MTGHAHCPFRTADLGHIALNVTPSGPATEGSQLVCRSTRTSPLLIIKHVKGMEANHMTWLKRADRRWGIEDEGKIGDLKLASQIREICNSVADSAEAVSVLYYGPRTETKNAKLIDMNVPRSVPKENRTDFR